MNHNTQEKILSLQALRAVAFVGVVLEHTEVIYIGGWGVCVFFVLSGFLMIYKYYDKEITLSAKTVIFYSLKKIAKQYPLYICTLIALFPLSGYMNYSFATNIKHISINVFLWQSLFRDGQINSRFNGAAWFLSAYMFILLCVPYIILLIRKWRNKLASIAFSIFAIIFQIVFSFMDIVDSYYFPISRLMDVIVGVNLGYLYITRRRNLKESVIVATLKEFICILFTFISIYAYFKMPGKRFWILLPSVALLVWIFALNKGYVSKILSNRFFVTIGNVSQYGFLIHVVIIRYIIVFCKHVLQYELDNAKLFVGSFILTLLVSEVWKYIDKVLFVRIVQMYENKTRWIGNVSSGI